MNARRGIAAGSEFDDRAGTIHYLKEILTKIAEGHTINRIDELMPWQMSTTAEPQPP